jgi:hypothetical protein
MKDDIFSKMRESSWSKLGQLFENFGWKMAENSPKIKKFVRGKEVVSAVKVAPGKWKVLYLERGKMMDFAGIDDEEFTKIMAGELLLLKSMTKYWSSS